MATAQIKRLTSMKPLDIDVPYFKELIAKAKPLGVLPATIRAANAVLSEAVVVQSRRDSAAANLLVAASVVPCDTSSLSQALARAEEAGVSQSLSRLPKLILAEAESGRADGRKGIAERLKADKAMAKRAAAERVAMERAAAATTAAEKEAEAHALQMRSAADEAAEKARLTAQSALDANYHLRASEQAVLKTRVKMQQMLEHTHVKLTLVTHLDVPLEQVDVRHEIRALCAKLPHADERMLFVSVHAADGEATHGSSLMRTQSIARYSLARAYSLAGPHRGVSMVQSDSAPGLGGEASQVKAVYFAPLDGEAREGLPLAALGAVSKATKAEVSNFVEARAEYDARVAAYETEFAKLAKVEDAEGEFEVRRKIYSRADELNSLVELCATKAQADEEETRRARAAALQAQADAEAANQAMKPAVEKAEARAQEANAEYDSATQATEQARRLAVHARREAEWAKQAAEVALLTLNATKAMMATSPDSKKQAATQDTGATKGPDPSSRPASRDKGAGDKKVKKSWNFGMHFGMPKVRGIKTLTIAQAHSVEHIDDQSSNRHGSRSGSERLESPRSPPPMLSDHQTDKLGKTMRRASSVMLLTFGGEVTNLAATMAEVQQKAFDPEAYDVRPPDGFAWAPLSLTFKSSRLELLLRLTRNGIYNEVAACQWVARECAVTDPTLVEAFVARLSAENPLEPLNEAAFGAVLENFLGQLLALTSLGLGREPPRCWLDPPRQTFDGGPMGTSLGLGLEQPRTAGEWASIAEHALVLLGMAALASQNGRTDPGLAGLLHAWNHAASLLPLDMMKAHLTEVYKFNAAAFVEASDEASEEVAWDGSRLERHAVQVEAALFALVKLAWDLPNAEGALAAIEHLLLSDASIFRETYMRKGSRLRSHVEAVLASPGTKFRLDKRWESLVNDSLIDLPYFWSEPALGLFGCHIGYEAEVACVKGILAKAGGASFYLEYLKRICDMDSSTAAETADHPEETVRANLRGLLEHHHLVISAGGASRSVEEGEVAALYRCVVYILGASMRSRGEFDALLPVWLNDDQHVSPTAALAGAAALFEQELAEHEAGYRQRREAAGLSPEDEAHERVILAMMALFVKRPEALTGFQNLVPRVFDVYLAQKTILRSKVGEMLRGGGTDANLVTQIEMDDNLVRQTFFWSAPGMKLFGGHPDLQDADKLRGTLSEALAQQPSILVAFLQQTITALENTAKAPDAARTAVLCLDALLGYIQNTDGALLKFRSDVMTAVKALLDASIRYYDFMFEGCVKAWCDSEASSLVVSAFVADFKLELQSEKAVSTKDAQSQEYIVQCLAALFIAQPSRLDAFQQLVPRVFETHLQLKSAARNRLNALLLKSSFDETLEYLIAETDDLVRAPFFWNDQVMPLCTKKCIANDYPTLNTATLKKADGTVLRLFPSLLALLLRLSSIRGGDPTEIARRTKEVLDQFERNPDQQQFILTIFETLDKRSRDNPRDFDSIKLTDLSDVAQNGVQTISSVQGDKMELCERAMTTLLQAYIKERNPSEWKFLFKEATNIGFMVKYMFRENLPLAKEKFSLAVSNKDNFKKMPKPAEAQEALRALAEHTMDSYGDVGIFDPQELANIDFLNNPELLVDLVHGSKSRMSRVEKADMQMMTEVTTEWMRYMVEKKFPPLTPHHTQAFTVMMMARCYQEHLSELARIEKSRSKKGIELRAFIAQLATGEGKSIVIAMLAVFMTQLFGLKVHVLENNEGLLERDFRQNKPFYERFKIKSSTDLDDEEAQIVYCLKANMNKHFLRQMLKGSLDAELKRTVIIVDEVDDLVVNERPINFYVKKDTERTPDLHACYKALKEAQGQSTASKPVGVDQSVWQFACQVAHDAENNFKEGVHWRLVNEGGIERVLMLNEQGEVPKVPLSAPWLEYLSYKILDKEPSAQSRYATICTPYMFNKYAGIFGLTGSVGGTAELKYLTKTYSAVKFDVPRFLDTCVGNARKEVKNHGVELVDSQDALVARVGALAEEYYKLVPVLVICSCPEEVVQVVDMLKGKTSIPSDEVLRFTEFDADGKSLKDSWQTIIEDSTKRLGGVGDNRCRVTVTDNFGGRGHDFQVIDKESNMNGGMLVIATSIPDEREWIQWKGRTARQDRPGQFYVILNKANKPFSEKPRLEAKLKKLNNDEKIEALLEVADEGIGAKLKAFEGLQAVGDKLNQLSEKYYEKHPRSMDDPWPHEKYFTSDSIMRNFMTVYVDKSPSEVTKLAKEELGIVLD